MTIGASLMLRVITAILAMLAAGGAAGADWSLEQLMHELAQVKSARAKFTERKEVAILNAPLDSSGTLIYSAPGRLEKNTLAPRQESIVLEGDRLTLDSRERKQRRTFALKEYPVIWAFVESVRSTLAGDLPTLRRFYQVSLEGDERRWRLVLKPVEPAMLDVVSEIRIGGSQDRLVSMEFVEANGDRSTMTITRDAP